MVYHILCDIPRFAVLCYVRTVQASWNSVNFSCNNWFHTCQPDLARHSTHVMIFAQHDQHETSNPWKDLPERLRTNSRVLVIAGMWAICSCVGGTTCEVSMPKRPYSDEVNEVKPEDQWNGEWWYFCACTVCHDRDRGKTLDQVQPVAYKTCTRHFDSNSSVFHPSYISIPAVHRIRQQRIIPNHPGTSIHVFHWGSVRLVRHVKREHALMQSKMKIKS